MNTDENVRKSLENATGLPVRITRWVGLQSDGGERLLSEKIEVIERRAPEPPAELLSACTAKAAAWLARAIEGNATPEEVGKLAEEFARQSGEMVAKRIVAMDPEAWEPVVRGRANVGEDEERENGADFKAPTPAGPEGDPIDPTADPELAGTPRKKSKEDAREADPDPDDPNPKLPHLDAARGKKLAEISGPPIITNAASKSALVKVAKSAGFESLHVDDQGILHMIHPSWKSELMIHPCDGFAIRSAYTGATLAGLTTDDLIASFDEQ
jgi:hypothetical protein